MYFQIKVNRLGSCHNPVPERIPGERISCYLHILMTFWLLEFTTRKWRSLKLKILKTERF